MAWIPRPVVRGISAGAVKADERAAVFEPRLERRPLFLGVGVPARVVPHRDFELLELIRVEHRRVLGHVGGPTVLLGNLDQGLVRGLD